MWEFYPLAKRLTECTNPSDKFRNQVNATCGVCRPSGLHDTVTPPSEMMARITLQIPEHQCQLRPRSVPPFRLACAENSLQRVADQEMLPTKQNETKTRYHKLGI